MLDQTLRLFIAINVPGALAAHLANEQRALGGRQAPVKWIDPAGAHITLQFLGAVSAQHSAALLPAIEVAAQDIQPFTLRLKGLGAFPNLRRPRVIWAGVEGQISTLEALQRRVVQQTAPLGFAPEERPFRPHITLGRVREGAGPAAVERLGRAIAERTFSVREIWRVEHVSLMRSELHPSGARYTALGQIVLGGGYTAS